MLLLRDFFRVPPVALPTSSVAFSLSSVRFVGAAPPIDLRVRRVGGTVVSPDGAIFTPTPYAVRVLCMAVSWINFCLGGGQKVTLDARREP